MPVWSIVLIVVLSVVALLVAAFLVGSLVAVDYVLKRKTPPQGSEEERAAYGIDISWFGAHSDVTDTLSLCSYDGLTLRALHIRQRNGEHVRRVAILQHGYGASPTSVQPHAKIFYDLGYDVVLPAARAHDISDGKYVGMAWLDRFDIMRWINKVVDIYGDDVSIALLGVSMGGATVVAVSGMNPPKQVKCVIDDCGFSSQKEEYIACVRKVPLPKSLAVLPLSVGVRLKLGYSVGDADITQFSETSTVPTLFIHGTEDNFVPCEQGKKLYEACAAPYKDIYLVEGAHHAKCFVQDPESYTAKVADFVSRFI